MDGSGGTYPPDSLSQSYYSRNSRQGRGSQSPVPAVASLLPSPPIQPQSVGPHVTM